MTLRIVGSMAAANMAAAAEPAAPSDGWASRLAKLIPAEALGLYGAGSSLVSGAGNDTLRWILAAACLVFAAGLRYVATRDATGKPQWIAIGIAVVSLVLWLGSLPSGGGPLDLQGGAKVAGLLALIWATVVPAFYKG